MPDNPLSSATKLTISWQSSSPTLTSSILLRCHQPLLLLMRTLLQTLLRHNRYLSSFSFFFLDNLFRTLFFVSLNLRNHNLLIILNDCLFSFLTLNLLNRDLFIILKDCRLGFLVTSVRVFTHSLRSGCSCM